MMNRRRFLAAAIAAPWVVRSGVLMPVRQIITPPGIVGYTAHVGTISPELWREQFVESLKASLISQLARHNDRLFVAAFEGKIPVLLKS